MKIDTEFYVLVRLNGEVAGDGESPCVYTTSDEVSEAIASDYWRGFLERVNASPLRIAKVRLVEIKDDAGANLMNAAAAEQIRVNPDQS